MSSLQDSTLAKLTLAKEMFILGHLAGKKNTRVDRMLSILNFDFTAVTLIVSSCLDKGENPKQKNGKAKKWDDLLTSLKNFYGNQGLINDIDNQHDLRNSIQHGDIVPSEWDVIRFEKITKNFFDDVLSNVYSGKVTFDSVSMSSLVKSPHEKTLLEFVEKYISENNYPLAYQFLLTVAIYHYMLIITNLKLPFGKLYLEKATVSAAYTAEEGVELLSERLQNAIDRLAMGEYYLRLKEILNKSSIPIDLQTAYHSLSKLEPVNSITYDEIQEDKATMFNIISGTEHWVTEKFIVDAPVVYGINAFDITESSAIINYGILAKLPIEECKLELHDSWKKDNVVKTMSLSKDTKYQSIKLDSLKPNTPYLCKIEATQQGDPEYKNHKSLSTARVKFQTNSE